MQARRAEIEIIYNDTSVSKNILKFVTGFSYKDCASGKADQIDITVQDKEGLWIYSWFPKDGDYIKAKIKTINWNKEGDSKLFDCGLFFIDDLSFSGPPNVLSIGALSMPQNNFSTYEKTQTWEKVTVEQVAKRISDSAGLQLYYDADTVQIESTEQSNKSDMNFLYSLCSDYGLAMKVYNNKIIIFDEMKYESRKSVLTLSKTDLISWNGSASKYGVYDGVELSYSGTSKKETINYSFKVRDGSRILRLNDSVDSVAEAEKVAKAKLRAANKEENKLSISMKGNLNPVSGCCVDIVGLGVFDGKYYVDELTHKLGGGFTTNCELHRVLEGGY